MAFNVKTDPYEIICNGNVTRLIEAAQASGQELAWQQISTSQIRNVFGEVRSIEMNWGQDPEGSYRRAVLLQPKLAYAAAKLRDNERGARAVKLLAAILTACIDEVRKAPKEHRWEYFGRFVDFFEAIVAYHRQETAKPDNRSRNGD